MKINKNKNDFKKINETLLEIIFKLSKVEYYHILILKEKLKEGLPLETDELQEVIQQINIKKNSRNIYDKKIERFKNKYKNLSLLDKEEVKNNIRLNRKYHLISLLAHSKSFIKDNSGLLVSSFQNGFIENSLFYILNKYEFENNDIFKILNQEAIKKNKIKNFNLSTKEFIANTFLTELIYHNKNSDIFSYILNDKDLKYIYDDIVNFQNNNKINFGSTSEKNQLLIDLFIIISNNEKKLIKNKQNNFNTFSKNNWAIENKFGFNSATNNGYTLLKIKEDIASILYQSEKCINTLDINSKNEVVNIKNSYPTFVNHSIKKILFFLNVDSESYFNYDSDKKNKKLIVFTENSVDLFNLIMEQYPKLKDYDPQFVIMSPKEGGEKTTKFSTIKNFNDDIKNKVNKINFNNTEKQKTKKQKFSA